MSGHSKWSTIKRKKEKIDAERGKMFTRFIREITTAARVGGGDENANPRLRTAVVAARAANMPMTNIEKAIKKGTGELPGVVYEEKTYEGYGPGGVAVIVDTMTDNTNRTTSEIRHMLSKYNGNLGETGCVSWMFEKKGLFAVNRKDCEEEKLMDMVLEAGADDLTTVEDAFEIITSPDAFVKVKDALESHKIPVVSAEITMVPKTVIKLDGKQAEQIVKLMESLEEYEDVQNVYSNFDIEETP